MLSRIAQSGPPPFDRRFGPSEVFDFTKGTRGLIKGTAPTCSGGVNGTVFGPDGVLRQQAAPRITHDPVGRTNYASFSEDLTNSVWQKYGCAATTATRFTATAGTGYHYINRSYTAIAPTLPAGTSIAYSARAKYVNNPWIFIALPSDSQLSYFNVQTGVWGTVSGSVTSNSATLQADGSYVIKMTAVSVSPGNHGIGLSSAGTSGSGNFTAAGTEALDVLWQQFEVGAACTPYIPAPSAFTTVRDCLGLLVEPQSVNYVRNSTMVGAGAGSYPTGWFVASAVGLTFSAVGSGVENGIEYVDIRLSGTSTAAAGLSIIVTDSSSTDMPVTTGDKITGSAFLKLVGGSISNLSALFLQPYSLNSGFIYVSGAPVDIKGTLTSAPLNTQRRSSTYTALATSVWGAMNLQFNFASGAAIDITLRVGLPQLEKGDVPTSPIKTSGAVATRTADSIDLSGPAFASVFDAANGGSVLAVGTMSPGVIPNTDRYLAAMYEAGGSNSDRHVLYVTGAANNNVGLYSATANVVQASLYTALSGSAVRGAFAVAANDFATCCNGGSMATDSSGTLPPVAKMTIGHSQTPGVAAFNGTISKVALWKSRLTNAQLQALTTL